MVESVGFNPSPNPTFIPITPDEKRVLILVPVLDRSKRPVTRVVYALWVLRVCEEHDNRQDLIAAFRRSWPCDVQSVDVARVDGLDDLPRSSGN